MDTSNPFQAILSAVDFSNVQAGIMTIAAAGVVVILALKGWQKIKSAISGI